MILEHFLGSNCIKKIRYNILPAISIYFIQEFGYPSRRKSQSFTALTRISARDGISKPTSISSDLLFTTCIFPSMPLARRTFLINLTIGRYDSQAVTIPCEPELLFESESPIARAAIIDSNPVPALLKHEQTSV